MQIGLAEVNITPPLGMQVPGYGSMKRPASGVKDELMTKAMVIESKGQTLAFIVLDILSLERDISQAIRKRVHEFTGIPEEAIMISCTHTHTGPPRQMAESDDAYYEVLVQKSADAAIMAHSRKLKAKIGFGRGYEDTVAFNRRFFMKDGTVMTNPGILNPDIVRPEGPIDPEITVMRIDDENGNPLGIVSNYALHTDTVGGNEYSGDFPAYISRIVKRTYGEHVVSIFFQGASGNINHIDVSGGNLDQPLPDYIRIGEILGHEICKVRNKIKADLEDVNLSVESRIVEVSERKLTEAEVAWARERLEALAGMKEEEMSLRQLLDRSFAMNRLRVYDQPVPVHSYEIQTAAIGDLAVCALPAEIFVEFGMEIKKNSPFEYTMINELSNGSGNGYVCTRDAYENGGYEPTGHRFAVEAGEIFVNTTMELLGNLRQKEEAAAK